MQMTRDYIEQHEVISRYVQNKLKQEELDSFEIFILEHPDIILRIEEEQVWLDAFREHQGLLQQSKQSGLINRHGRSLAVAACLVVALAVVLSLPTGQNTFVLQPPIRVETFRNSLAPVIQASGQAIVQFQVDMGPAELLEANLFTAVLVDASGSEMFRVAGLSADTDGWLYYALIGQNEALTGRYELRVAPQANADAYTSYIIEFATP